MKPSLQSPIRTKVKEVSDNDDKHAQKTHANKTLSEITYKKRTEDVQAIKTDAIPEDLKQEASNGVCDVVAKWKGIKGQFSTYDLLATVNYTTDENGNYPFPVRKYDEIAKEISSDSEILNVYLVPFSHADPGYGLTFEQYYQHKTSKTLNLMVTKLTKYPKMTFQWAETVFLERWFRDINDEAKNKVRDLVKSGRLEIVLGGWVMPDEASTHYASVVDQLIEGHTWLAEHLHVRPRTAWVNDPFGYSGTMPYLWRQAGMENLLALRINQPLKARLVTLKSLEFLWRPYHSTSAGSDVLTSLMPFTNYWVDDVCGPDPKICSIFNYLHLHEKGRRAVAVTDQNIAELSELFYKQLRITGDLYKYRSLYIGLGEDFSYVLPEEWDNIFVNFDKIMDYINNKSEWKMKIKFGTVSEYFDNVRQRETTSKNPTSGNSSDFPVISGDLFPYTERKGEFWTGYYTSRPFLKAFSRDIGSLVHAADVLNVLVTGTFRYYGVTYAGQRDAARALTDARRELGMFLHHDGITGTSLPHVIQDFEARLMKAHARAHVAMKTILTSLLSRGKVQNSAHLQEVIVKENSRDIPRYRVLDVGDGSNLVFYNPVSKRRIEIVSVYVKSKHFVINTPKKSHIEVQVTETKGGVFMASFEIDIQAFGIEVYKLLPKEMDHSIVKETEVFGESIELKNKYMKVVFSSKTGLLQTMILSSGNVINITADFMVYKSKRSGAYIFGPEGPATGFKTGNAVITTFYGRMWSEVAVTRPGFTQKYRLYNTDSLQRRGLHVSTSTDMASVGMREMEVIYRVKSSINNGHNFYADQNGFQLIGRETMPTKPIASNYYPATTMALLEDDRLRMTLHFRQPHGVASLASGQLDTMLDRHTFRDDGRGLGQGIYDNVNVMNEFVIEVEEKAVQFNPIEKRYTYATSKAVLLNEFLQNKLQIYTTKDNSVKLMDKVHPLKDVTLPCHTSVVGFRNIVDDDMKYSYTSLVLHRRPVHCGLTRTEDNLEHFCHVKQEKVTIKSLFPKLKVKIEETSLTLQNTKNVLELDSNILPEKNELRTFKIHM
ncbi:MA2A2-like protein [Mya arenaria]|uniref:Alpha-mannosidase n=2 Tax=Mya arenaria TaxID=6604 RepID=A0ABY7G0S1_MYAAR|nr:MA2A2-like protein [Mya arenaria]